MSLAAAVEMARAGRLYPSVILHGGSAEERAAAAAHLARTLLCEAPTGERPCGSCRHCRRVAMPGEDGGFHPDFFVLERDLKTATSVEATKELLRPAQLTPFEARGQVFVVASAESLTGEAANALLKTLEEPPGSSQRHFLLLAPSQFDLLPTLRSRSLAVFLGGGERVGDEELEALAEPFAGALARLRAGEGAARMAAAAALLALDSWRDPRAQEPWERAAEVVLHAGRRQGLSAGLLALADDLLSAHRARVRGIPAARIVEGLVHRHLAAEGPAAALSGRRPRG
ncbi:MAG: hypothetical protein R3325_01275 [Thermoanaerobaculia bacterium]|nr:hypothetical protein [Thermoanaerobaculia bacterium]